MVEEVQESVEDLQEEVKEAGGEVEEVRGLKEDEQIACWQRETFVEWLKKIGLPHKLTKRVIIDIQVERPAMVYIEEYGSVGMLKVEPPDFLGGGAKVVVLDKGTKEGDVIEAPPVEGTERWTIENHSSEKESEK